jgi:hypothetical protein
MLNMSCNSVSSPAVREKMIGRKELIEGRGGEGELVEADNKLIPTLGVGGLRDVEYEVKHCEGTPL